MNGMNFGRVRAYLSRPGSVTPPGKKSKTRRAWIIALALIGCLVVYSGVAGLMRSANLAADRMALPLPNSNGSGAAQTSNAPATGGTESDYALQPATGGGAPQAGGGGSANTTTTSQAWDRMLIRTGTVQSSVNNVLSSVDMVMSVAEAHGGRVLQMNNQQSDDYSTSTVVIQVPSDEFDKVIPELHKLGGQVKKVISENISSQDVTEEYTDLQSQLRNLQATESRLLALQQKADKLEDILSLDHELRDIQGQIEQITGRTNYLSKRSEMSQITVTLMPAAATPTPLATPQSAWDPGEIALQSWEASLDLLSKLATVAITVVVFLWWVLPLLLVGWWLTRRWNRRPVASAQAGGGEAAS